MSESAKGLVVWLTGLPSSGKSTLAREVQSALDVPALLLDGDAVRAVLRPEPGHGAGAREAFYETLAGLAALTAEQGLVVLVPATAHRAAFRERARALAPAFVEIFVDTPLAECERRDAKGLYARARRGELPDVPGIGVPFEAPQAPDLRVLPDQADARERVVELIRRAKR